MIKVVDVVEFSDWDEIYDINFNFTSGKHGSKELQNIITFDIEQSNGWLLPDYTVIGFDHDKYNTDEEYQKLIDTSQAISVLYIWQMAIETQDGPKVFAGRTWDDYIEFVDKLTMEIRRQSMYGQKCINRHTENIICKRSKHTCKAFCFIHNASYEFQAMRNVWENDLAKAGGTRSAVFARTARKPMKFTIKHNMVTWEHRDTLVLVQKSLDNWCKDEKLPTKKLHMPDDYYLTIRTPNTELTHEEIQYSINDVVSMVYGVEKYRERFGTLNNIPLTQTGIVRRTCKEKVADVNKEWAMHCVELQQSYTPEMFKKLTQLFQGGWTHGNKMFINKTLKNIVCFDFASSYPACIVSRRFPIGKFEQCDCNEFDALASQDINTADYRWFAKVKLTNVRSKLWNSYWSLSKVCLDDMKPLIKGQCVDNGRIYACDEMTILLTDLDWDTFKQCYTYDEDFEVLELYKSKAGYLCKELILTILEYFAYKTSLKGDESMESLYNESKQFINSIYGLMVYKYVSDLIEFNKNGWCKNKNLTGEDRDKLFNNMFYEITNDIKPEKTFTAYQFGVWVTSWARHNLFDFIIKFDRKIAYCDTDSIKGLFTDEDIEWIENYNKDIAKLEDKVAKELGFDASKFTAVTKKGKVKRLGIMEREEDCEEFKTLGAKRYVDLIDGKIHCTIAGLPKSAGEKKIKSVSDFNNNTYWNTRESEKLMTVYNDSQPTCTWTDYQGHTYIAEERFGLCLQPTTFDLSMSKEFEMFLKTISRDQLIDDDFFTTTPSWLYQ